MTVAESHVKAADLERALASLWAEPQNEALAAILPKDAASLRNFPAHLRDFVAGVERGLLGTIDSAAIIRGDVVAMGEGAVIEAGAVVHESCRLVLGARSRIRAGAVLRGEVVVGDDCLIGVHCEVWRSVVLGPNTAVAHGNFVGDSILGRDVVVSGNVIVANNTMEPGKTVRLRVGSAVIDSGRTHLGMLVGDGARLGMSTRVCPGTVVLPGIAIPPGMVLLGTIDAERRRKLLNRFFAEWGE